MAVKISAMTAAAALDGTEGFEAVQAAASVKATAAQIAAFVRALALVVPAAAPADADIGTSEMRFWVDETTHTLKIRVRYSDGVTLKTGEVPLA